MYEALSYEHSARIDVASKASKASKAYKASHVTNYTKYFAKTCFFLRIRFTTFSQPGSLAYEKFTSYALYMPKYRFSFLFFLEKNTTDGGGDSENYSTVL